jgi:hypothetical protein
LPYSTPRAPNSRVFFTISTSSLMAEKTLHTKISSQRNHTCFTTISHQSTTHLSSQLLHTNYLHYNLVHTYLLHTNYLHYNLLANHTIYIPNTTIYNQIFTTHYTKIYVNILDDAPTTWMWRSQQVVILLVLEDRSILLLHLRG